MMNIARKSPKSAGFNLLRRNSRPPSRLFSADAQPSGDTKPTGETKPPKSKRPVIVQMGSYALNHARSLKTDEGYRQGLAILDQCLTVPSDEPENAKAVSFLAMSTLLYERGKYTEAIDKLRTVQELSDTSLPVRVVTIEALTGLHLHLGEDDTSSELADKGLQLIVNDIPKTERESGSDITNSRIKAAKGLVELVHGNFESAKSLFPESPEDRYFSGNAALSYGEYLHATRKFSTAKELYQKIIQETSETKEFLNPYALSAGNMGADEVLFAATCALGQLEAHMGNFGDAEEILTKALKQTEEFFGESHPKVGVILTCIALMYRHKAAAEQSSSLVVQEGLYRKALDLLNAPSLDAEDAETKVDRKDIVALARGGYAEALSVQENRKEEGEKLKNWAEGAWRNCRLSLAEALDISEKIPVIDARLSRAL